MKQLYAAISQGITLMVWYCQVVVQVHLQVRHTPAANKLATHSHSQRELLVYEALCLLCKPSKNEAVFYQVELIWGIDIQRNYTFCRRRPLDFHWVLKIESMEEAGEVGVVGTIKLYVITRRFNTKLNWYASFMTKLDIRRGYALHGDMNWCAKVIVRHFRWQELREWVQNDLICSGSGCCTLAAFPNLELRRHRGKVVVIVRGTTPCWICHEAKVHQSTSGDVILNVIFNWKINKKWHCLRLQFKHVITVVSSTVSCPN